MEAQDKAFSDVSLTHPNSEQQNDDGGGQLQTEFSQQQQHESSAAAGSATSSAPTPQPRDQQHSESVGGDNPGAAVASAEPQPTSYAGFEYYSKRSGDFYSSSDGVFERAVENIKTNSYRKDIDGEVIGAWLLLEVDHWDNETEKIVLLTENSLLTVRFDFIPMKVYKFKTQALKDFDTVQIGDFKYPEKSLLNFSPDLKRRTCGGVRLLWNKGVTPSFLQRWLPASDAMPWLTFTYHPLAFSERGKDNTIYNVENFTQAVIDAIQQAYSKHTPGQSLIVKEEPLHQDIYVGLPSQVHNQSFLGMSKERGGISF